MQTGSNEPSNPSPRQAASDHIPLHRLWSFARVPGQLDTSGQAHVRECADCRRAFQLCLGAENFGIVLKELNHEQEALAPDDDGKPKLKTLYVVPGAIRTLRRIK